MHCLTNSFYIMENKNKNQGAQNETSLNQDSTEHLTYWIRHLRKDSKYGNIVFKRLEKGFRGYPHFVIDEDLLDVVDLEVFCKTEVDRVPLFIGTPLGIYPNLFGIPDFFSDDRIVAILGKSLFTGVVAALSFYAFPAGSSGLGESIKIASFRNEIQKISFNEDTSWYEDHFKWKKACKCWHVQGLSNRYNQENPDMTFEEFVTEHNVYDKDLSYAKFLVQLWHRDKDLFLIRR